MIFVTDAAGHCIHVGREWVGLSGQPIKQALGLGWIERVHPEDQDTVRKTVETAARGASEFSLRYRVLQPDDQPCWVAAGCLPSFGPPGENFIGYLGSLTWLADSTTEGLKAYGNIGRYVPPPPQVMTTSTDHLDQIADHLILAHWLIETDGVRSALPALRVALYEVGVALAARREEPPTLN